LKLSGDFGNGFEEAEEKAALDGVVDPECSCSRTHSEFGIDVLP